MYTLADFQNATQAAVSGYPTASAAYQAGDPRLRAQLDAMAAMLFMLSQQIDLAEVEPFLKARDGTVMADMALKGVLPLARAAVVTLTVTNKGTSAVAVAAGRTLLDAKGRVYTVTAPATVPAASGGTPGSVQITAAQQTTRTVSHSVASTQPFYAIQVPASPDGLQLVALDVADTIGAFRYAQAFHNVEPGERVFHAETDEYRRLFVRFGAEDSSHGLIIGHQPANGDLITLTITECEGQLTLSAGDAFALQYIATPADTSISMVLSSVQDSGADVLDMDTMRVLAQYPSTFDGNAVYLGNFDFLLRKALAGANFLSVWNEQVEEQARGVDVSNINKLFVAFDMPGETPTTTQARIRQTVASADSSYAVVFRDPAATPVPMTITASVGIVHDPAAVAAAITALVLANFGVGSSNAARGLMKFMRYQSVYKLLRDGIPALQDSLSDFSIALGTLPTPLPEQFLYVSPSSLTVNVTRSDYATGLMNH